jgi:hypothetical protein
MKFSLRRDELLLIHHDFAHYSMKWGKNGEKRTATNYESFAAFARYVATPDF